MSGNRAILAIPVVAAWLAGTACLYSPPERLPSSIRILYSKAVQDTLESSTDVYFLVARSGNELRLTGEEGVDTQPTFASEMLRVFFTREADGRSEIWSMEFDGSDERPVLGGSEGDYRDPALAPDESRLAFTRAAAGRSDLLVSDPEGTNVRAVVEGPQWRRPAWSPDGRRLVVVGRRGGVPRLFVVDAAGGEPTELAPASPGAQDHPSWSPDGNRIAFTHGTGSGAEIAVVEVETGAVTVLTDNGAEDTQPAWGPGGEQIVFVSRRPKGRDNLWLMDADGGDVVSLTESEDADAGDPEWL